MGKPEDTNGGNQKIPMVKTKRYQWSKPEDINEETRRYQYWYLLVSSLVSSGRV
jgi:hypothetical protein